jgi:hypothetical protein
MAAMTEPGGAPKVQRLVEDIRALQDAVRTLRAAGMEAELPAELVAACRELVELDAHGQSKPCGRSVADDLSDIPLRRLVWRVLTPGETFTVPQVVERLADLGVDVEAPKVSNVLGYWFARDELQRRRKGVYYYPLLGSDLAHRGAEDETGASHAGRPKAAGRDQGQAVPSPETEDSGDTTRGQEVTRRAG